VNHHGLEIGDFTVFKYISKSYFNVKIFQRTGCVKNINALQLMNTNIDIDKNALLLTEDAIQVNQWAASY